MTYLFQDAIFEEHRTGFHPECPQRTQNLRQYTAQWLQMNGVAEAPFKPVSESLLQSVHDDEQIALIKRLASQGGGQIDADTVVSGRSWDVVRSAAGAAIGAVDAVLSGQTRNALCLIRPPGHHATAQQSMGFCLLNNVAIAVKYAQKIHQLDRVLVVDWDVHHGNGSQDVFYEDPSVSFFSIHRYPFYPGTGHSSETGRGPGVGTTWNVPVSFGTSRERYLDQFRSGLTRAIQDFKPDLLVISAGFDAHKNDPVGSLGLEVEDFRLMTDEVCRLAAAECDGRVVSCLEGGYDIYALADCVGAHLQRLASASLVAQES
jgi:acetoin utilization deacetylase AcuC-like enzyme